MTFKPVDTAIVMVVGPCIDDTDMKTLEEAIAYNAAGMDVSLIIEKTDGTTSVTAITLTTGGTSDWTHIDGGYYEVEITAAQNTEEGIAYLRGVCTGVLPFESSRYDVVKANVYDSLIVGTDVLQVDVTQLAGVTQSLTDLKDLADTGYDPSTHKIQGIVLCDEVTALSATGADLILKDSTFALAIADAIWDEILTGATHNIAASAGKRVREIGAYAIHSGTAQAGNNVHITLAATASAVDGIYNRNLLVLIDGTGANQTRTVIDYDGTTKIATIDREWRVNPDVTTEYQIVADDTPLVVDQGIAKGGTSTTITLRDYASSIDNTYLCNIVIIVAGTGRGQARLVGTYNGTTKVVTICGDNWVTTPDATSVYVLIPYGASCVGCLTTNALSQVNGECDTALTDYDGPTRTEATSDKDEIIVEVNANETKVDAVQVDLTAVKGKTDNLPSGIAKGVALPKFDFLMILSSDHVTGATGRVVSGTISKDGGAFSAITNVITEVSSGMYVVASGFTATEMNANVVTLRFTAASCDDRIVTIHTT